MEHLVLITNLHMENDPGEWITHIQDRIPHSTILAVSTDHRIPEICRSLNIPYHHLKHKDLFDFSRELLKTRKAEWIVIWDANERMPEMPDLSGKESGMYRSVVRYQSDRLSFDIREVRIVHHHALRGDGKPHEGTAGIFVKPIMVKLDNQGQKVWLDSAKTGCDSDTVPLKRAIHHFGCQRYEKAFELFAGYAGTKGAGLARFFQILCCYNLDRMQKALELIVDAMNDEEAYAGIQNDLVYLYGKLAQHADQEELKRAAAEIIEDTLKEPGETVFVKTDESDLYALLGELYDQLGLHDEAVERFEKSLKSSFYVNENTAYRLADLLVKTADGREDTAKKLMQRFDLENHLSKRLLYLLFSYLRMDDWALMFYQSHECSALVGSNAGRKVSVILPVYNDDRYLFESIHSILSQTYIHLELIIVDDGSDERVSDTIRQFAYDTRVQTIRLDSNKGLPHALNRGLQLASGAYITWTSADNRAHPKWLERLVASLEANPDCAAAITYYDHIDEYGLVTESRPCRNYVLNGLMNFGPSFLWRYETVKAVGGFDERMFGIEDRDYSVRAALHGPVYLLPESLYYYRIHADSLSKKIGEGDLGGWQALHEKLKRKWLFLSFV